MRSDEPGEVHAERLTVFTVAAVRTGSRSPRVVVALAVAALAFLAGIQVGAGAAAEPAPPGLPAVTSAPTAVSSAVATALPVLEPPGSSSFAQGFRPAELIARLPGGVGCVTGVDQKIVPRSRQEGPRLTFVRHWMSFCPLPAERRQQFLLAVIEALVDTVPSETYGHSTSAGGPGSALFPYADQPFVGIVTVSADAAGAGFEVVITLEERLSQ